MGKPKDGLGDDDDLGDDGDGADDDGAGDRLDAPRSLIPPSPPAGVTAKSGTKTADPNAPSKRLATLSWILRWIVPSGLLPHGVLAAGAAEPEQKPIVETLSASQSWRAVLVTSAHACARHDREYRGRSSSYRSVGYLIAVLGVGFFVMVTFSVEQGASKHTADMLSRLEGSHEGIEQRFDAIRDFTDQEARRKFSFIEMQQAARDAYRDPAALQRFDDASKKAVEAIEASDRHRQADMTRDVGRFASATNMLRLLTEDEKRFIWHRDLLPLVRSVAMLLFVELFAGVFIALARRQESLALHWATERRRLERLLAAPGMLVELAEHKLPTTEGVLTAILAGGSPVLENEENPTLEALRLVSAAAEKVKPGK